ncbi:MAG: hypothetical protein GXN93_01385 [Candidatus Diapherotrites archaeon]|nr:hypothetical protein [Candidatus Diapherotrites archaeon]
MLTVEPGESLKIFKEETGITIPPAPEKSDAKVYAIEGGTVTIAFTGDGEPKIQQVIVSSVLGDYAKVSPVLSALFRVGARYSDVLDLLRGTRDPVLSSVADVIQDFLADYGILPKPKKEFEAAVQPSILSFAVDSEPKKRSVVVDDANLKICPVCGQRTLKVENGCETCINPECGYSKCDH